MIQEVIQNSGDITSHDKAKDFWLLANSKVKCFG